MYPDIPFSIVSAMRTFDAQKTIWEGKWDGSYNYLSDPVDRALGILTYSSMPSTSRHHWGTDFDLTNLESDYWTSGNGLFLYNWLVSNAHNWGFYQPYIAGRATGYSEERWHWSYASLSIPLIQDWFNNRNAILNSMNGAFEGSETANSLASTYVFAVNPVLLPAGSADPNDYETNFFCTDTQTPLLQDPCSSASMTMIPTNSTVRSLSCCKVECSGSFRLVTYGESTGYVNDNVLRSCNGTSIVRSSSGFIDTASKQTSTVGTMKPTSSGSGKSIGKSDTVKSTPQVEESSATAIFVNGLLLLVSVLV